MREQIPGAASASQATQEAARSLRICQQTSSPVFEAHRQIDAVSIARPIALRGAGEVGRPDKALRLVEQRDSVKAQADCDASAPRHFERVAEEAETRNIGHRVNFLQSARAPLRRH